MRRSNWSKITEAEKETLKEGNIYTFARVLLAVYPKFASEMDFDFYKSINCYKLYIEYDNGMFVFRADNGDKHFFDTEMKYMGAKAY